MLNFTYDNNTKMIFGKDTELQAAKEAKLYGNKVLIHYGGGSIKRNGLYERLIKCFQDENIEVFELPGVQPNPRLGLVREGIKLCRENKIDFILAVGGGSVIDSSKAIGMGTLYDGDVWDFYGGKAKAEKSLPVGVVLTIPAAGSESSTGSVINNEDGKYKRPASNPVPRPKFAILNPEITYSLPEYQTACGAADIMSHVMERYFTNDRDVDFTDRLCEGTLKTIIKNAPIVLRQPENYAARSEIMWAGSVAHNGLLNTGRTGDWGSHNIEHELSAMYDIAHGAGLTIITPAWMTYVYKHDMNRFVQFASRVWDIEVDINNPERTALEGIERTKNFFKSLGLPVSLKEANIPLDKLEEMAEKATRAKPTGNFVKLYKEDVISILKLAQ
ncbi:iron-containing alcohol dehydrogenase [Clostridium sp.]